VEKEETAGSPEDQQEADFYIECHPSKRTKLMEIVSRLLQRGDQSR
jgi:hypothetical protein